MTIVIPREPLHESRPHQFTAFASDLGLPPGCWPAELKVAEPLGNGQAFHRFRHEVLDGDLQSICYQQLNGCVTLTIFND